MTNFFQLFEQQVKRYARHPAVLLQSDQGIEQLTYEELRRQALDFAGLLSASGLKPGDRCALLGHNHPRWVAAYLGIVRLGAVAVPLDTNYNARQISTVLKDSGARILVASAKLRATAQQALEGSGEPATLLPLEPDGALAPDAPALPSVDSLAGGPVVVLYTSGTTSDPKGVVLSHENLMAEFRSIHKILTFTSEDRILAVLPLFHSLAQVANLLVPLGTGASVVFLENLNSTELLRALKERGITAFACVPQFFYLIHKKVEEEVKKSPWLKRTAFRMMLALNGALRSNVGLNLGKLLFAPVHRQLGPRMRYLVTGGSRFESRIGWEFYRLGFTILQAYGLTECTGGATATRPEDGWADSVGPPLPGVEVRIRPDPSVDPTGRTGEVALRGPNVMSGYYRRPDANEAVFDGEWFKTGDLGYLDSRGHLHITGRKKEVIVLSSGKNIYPEEIEAHYLQSPYLKEICVLGSVRPGEPMAERLHGIVVPDMEYLRERKMVNLREILRFEVETLSVQLPAHKRILSFDIWMEELPRTTTRKLKRFRIEQMHAERARQEAEPAASRGTDAESQAWLARTEVRPVLDEIQKQLGPDKTLVPGASLELDLGLDSMERVELLTHLEASFEAKVSEESAQNIFTVRELVEAVLESKGASGRQATQTDPWRLLLNDFDPDQIPNLDEVQKEKYFTAGVFWTLSRIVYLLSRLFFRFHIRGLERLPRSGPFMLCPNHQSYLDAILLVSVLPYRLFRQLFFVGASEYFESPFMRWLSRRANIVPVDADSNLLRAMQAGACGLRRGKILIIFPEGERSIDGRIKRFKKGCAILSTQLGVPIVPVALEGFFQVWPRGRGIQRLARLQMQMGFPVEPQGLPAETLLTEAEAHYEGTAELVQGKVQELWEELATSG